MNIPITKEDIKGFRILTEKSQSEFAESIGVSVDTIRKWEQGKCKPSKLAWQNLSKFVNKLKADRELK